LIRKAIIPAAGLGTRLLPATKEQPKEMLPVLAKDKSGKLVLKPFLQIIFEQLYADGFREFCFIVGRGKRSIEDHFTIDESFVEYLKSRNKTMYLEPLTSFYEKVRKSNIVFANQARPLGFADAVYRARLFCTNEDFLVHAGDDLILSKKKPIRRLISVFDEHKADAVFFVQKVKDPRKYGVVVGEEITKGVYHVQHVIEKPTKPPSKLAVAAIYIFKSRIHEAIELVEPGKNDEIQLTDAIQKLIDRYDSVYAVELDAAERRIEIGDPYSYREAFTGRVG
jgi:UTP--glucose-1-phosphate uridylyltransferase